MRQRQIWHRDAISGLDGIWAGYRAPYSADNSNEYRQGQPQMALRFPEMMPCADLVSSKLPTWTIFLVGIAFGFKQLFIASLLQIISPVSSSFPQGFACSVPVPAIVGDKMDWEHLTHRVLIGLLSVQSARQKQPVLQWGGSRKAESPRESRSKSPSIGPLTRLCLV